MFILSLSSMPGARRQLAWERHPFLSSLLLLCVITAASLSLQPLLSPTNLVMPYLLAVVLAALYLGYWPAIMSSGLSVLAFAYFFVPPRYGFSNKDSEYIVTFTALLVVGLVITALVNRLRERNELLEDMLEERKHAEAEMRAGRERLQLALQGAQMGLWDWDMENGHVALDERGAEILGYRPQELENVEPLWDRIVHPEDLPRLQNTWRSHAQGTTPLFAIEKRMRARDGNWKWIYATGRVVERDDAGRARRGVGTLLDITDRRLADDRLRFLAHHDSLTGLANRGLLDSLLTQALAHASRSASMVAVFFVDVDGFKSINDSLGHLAGDTYLEAMGQHLRASVRAEDVIARWGGDEFVVAAGDLGDEQAAAAIAAKLVAAAAQPIMLGAEEVRLSASVGIALFPRDGHRAGDLIRAADSAMYHAKQSGRNTLAFFAPHMDRRSRERLALENRLRQALAASEFVLHFQPQIELSTGKLAGAEALIRWNSPDRGLLAPAEFIRVAEQSGLIVEIGAWVVEQACSQAARWHAEGLGSMRIAVNVSAIQFRRPDFMEMLERLRRRLPGGAHGMELELTESVLLQDADAAIDRLHQLRDLGYRLAVDDFGTGYSSLAYLRRLPIDTLKIDRTFTHAMASDAPTLAVVDAMLALAHNVGATVVAEGVETAGQARLLAERGCDCGQGFYFAPPMPPAEFARWVVRGGASPPIA